MCGLKLPKDIALNLQDVVTPHVGVWIETWLRLRQTSRQEVTPHVGVWIETDARTAR